MHTAQELQRVTNGNIKRQLSSFELITNWIDTGYTLNLSSTAIQLMTVLLRFYNPDKKFVFPHQETLAERTNTSLATVKRGLNELIKAQLVIKTRKQTGNVYGFTSKLFELLDSSNCAIPTAQFEPCMKGTNKGTNKEQTTSCMHAASEPKKADVVSLSSFSLKQVPASILAKKTDKNGRPIRNHAAYWNSLTDAQKQEYLRNEEEQAAKTRKLEELKRQEAAEKQRQREEEKRLQEQLSRPLHEQWSKQQAIKHVWQTRNLHKGILKEGLTKSLVELYSLDVQAICRMTEAEIEKISL